VVLRLVAGIFALTFLPMGVAFTVVGLVADEVDEGDPMVFVYIGIPLALIGAAFAVMFVVLMRRERERRRRRLEGLRASVEVVRSHINPSVRSGRRLALELTVRMPNAGTPDGTVQQTFLVDPNEAPAEGSRIEVLYDPADPANFEPAR
jgi:hypothetical protein